MADVDSYDNNDRSYEGTLPFRHRDRRSNSPYPAYHHVQQPDFELSVRGYAETMFERSSRMSEISCAPEQQYHTS